MYAVCLRGVRKMKLFKIRTNSAEELKAKQLLTKNKELIQDRKKYIQQNKAGKKKRRAQAQVKKFLKTKIGMTD